MIKRWARNVLFIILCSIFLITMQSCRRVVGNGEEVTQTRAVSVPFNRIRVDGFYQVLITQGNVQSLHITTDKNIQPLIATTVKNGQLLIHNLAGYSFSVAAKPIVQISVQNLKALKISGDIKAKIEGLKEDNFTLFVAGDSNVEFDSNINNMMIRLTGAGLIFAKKAVINNAEIHLDGAGKIIIQVNGHLNVHLSGIGDITYFGTPTSIEQHNAGFGVLRHGAEK